jgi:hypothetical protein
VSPKLQKLCNEISSLRSRIEQLNAKLDALENERIETEKNDLYYAAERYSIKSEELRVFAEMRNNGLLDKFLMAVETPPVLKASEKSDILSKNDTAEKPKHKTTTDNSEVSQ